MRRERRKAYAKMMQTTRSYMLTPNLKSLRRPKSPRAISHEEARAKLLARGSLPKDY